MSLNNIQLPYFLIEEWYSDNLIAAPRTAPASNCGEFATITSNNIPTTPSSPPIATPIALTPPHVAAPSLPPIVPTPPNPATTNPTTTNPTTPKAAPSPIPTPSPSALKYLGNNRRNITLLVNAPGSAFLPDTQLSFLTKILEACRMTIADVAIVNIAATPATIAIVKETLQPKTILLFGLEPTAIRLPINFPVFKPIDYDACKYLSAPPLDQLVSNTEDSKLLKSKLWVCLKTIFDV